MRGGVLRNERNHQGCHKILTLPRLIPPPPACCRSDQTLAFYVQSALWHSCTLKNTCNSVLWTVFYCNFILKLLTAAEFILSFSSQKKIQRPAEPVLQHADLCHSQLNECSLSSAVLAHNNQCHGRNCTNSSVTRTAKSLNVPHYALFFLESTFNEIKLQNKEKQTLNTAMENLYICTIVSACVYRQKREFWYEKEWIQSDCTYHVAWRKQNKSLFLFSVEH